MKADLHVHTSNTDCSHSPDTVFRMAKASGLTALAITDHDTLYGIEENRAISQKYSVGYIPGIEISAYDYKNNVPCHIVGLNVRPGYRPLEEMIAAVTKKRSEHSNAQVQKLIEMGYEISPEDFVNRTGHHGIYKQHIMHVLIEKGYVKQMFGSFYAKMFKNGGPLQMKIDYPKHTDAVRVLAESGAFPILAHPTLYNNTGEIEILMDNGLKGVEVWYPAVREKEIPGLINICEEHGLFPSAGSDYHGYYGTDPTGHVGSHFVTNTDALLENTKEYAKAL